MRRLPTIFLTVLLLPALLSAAEDTTAADATERGRSLARILDVLLLPDEDQAGAKRTVLFLLDATDSLRTADFATELESALSRNAEGLAGTRIAVARVGDSGGPVCPPTDDFALPVKAAATIVANPEKAFQNVYYEVRRMAGALAGAAGARQIVLLTLENGDVEDDLAATVAALKRADVRLSVVAGASYH